MFYSGSGTSKNQWQRLQKFLAVVVSDLSQPAHWFIALTRAAQNFVTMFVRVGFCFLTLVGFWHPHPVGPGVRCCLSNLHTMTNPCAILLLSQLLFLALPPVFAQPIAYSDPQPQRYNFTARASQIDPRVQAHPEIDFLIDNENGKPADLQQAAVDTRVAPKGRLVIWLMGHNQGLFDRWSSYGLHSIRVHYANKWFSICCKEKPVGEHCRGNIRLEAATGEDFSEDVSIPKPDGMMERTYQFVKWLSKEHPQGKWEQFLSADGSGLNWDKIIVSGSSHGSTTAARFAKHQKVARVVALCGPRDNFQSWQALPSATPANRYFGFSHVLDGGWTADHYCRSWELLGLHNYGPIINVDSTKPPFENSRRLITDFDVGGNARRAHSSVQPGGSAAKGPDGKTFLHEDVWRYLYTHPVDVVGRAVPQDPNCEENQRQ
jgi:hypothetical protein